MDSSLTPKPEHSERISRSMRVLSYEEAKQGVSHYIEEPLQVKGGLTSWDLSFAEYVEEHKDSKLLFCWYDKGVGVVFSPADHHGIWAAQRPFKQGARAPALCNLSRGSGEEQRSNLICLSGARYPRVNMIAASSDYETMAVSPLRRRCSMVPCSCSRFRAVPVSLDRSFWWA
jgi:hypothetical protein